MTGESPSAGSRRLAGVAAILLATVFWSFGSFFGKRSGASGLVLTFWRMWMGSGLFALIAAVLRRWPTWADARRAAPAGVLFGLNVAAFFTALEHVPVATALIIAALAPVVVLPITVLVFHERLTALKLICAFIAVVGVVIAVIAAPDRPRSGGSALAGYLWAAASMVLWLAYLLLSKGVRRHVETVRFLLVVSVAGALAVSLAVVIGGESLDQIHGSGWLWVLCLALLPGVCGHGLVAWAQPRVDASVTAVLIQAEPVFASIVAWVLLDEAVTAVQGVAGLGVIAALAVLAWREASEGSVEVSDVPV